MSLGDSDANVDKTISILKAKEAAQGALAAAATKLGKNLTNAEVVVEVENEEEEISSNEEHLRIVEEILVEDNISLPEVDQNGKAGQGAYNTGLVK